MISVIQATGNSIYTTGSSASKAFASGNGSGRCLVATGWFNGLTGAASVTDTQGNVWTQVGTAQVSNSGGTKSVVFICLSCASGANTVTLSGVGATFTTLTSIAEIAGVTALDQVNQGHTSSPGSTYTSPTITTTVADSIVIAHFQAGNDPVPSVNSPLTALSVTPANQYSCCGYVIESATGTYSGACSEANADTGSIIFNLAGGGAGPPAAKPVVCIMQ
jgi:hypothetical protein